MSDLLKIAIKNTIRKPINYSMKQRSHLGIAYVAENGDIFFSKSIKDVNKSFNKSEEIDDAEFGKDIALVEQLNKTNFKF